MLAAAGCGIPSSGRGVGSDLVLNFGPSLDPGAAVISSWPILAVESFLLNPPSVSPLMGLELPLELSGAVITEPGLLGLRIFTTMGRSVDPFSGSNSFVSFSSKSWPRFAVS